jgi:hypothetical protein
MVTILEILTCVHNKHQANIQGPILSFNFQSDRYFICILFRSMIMFHERYMVFYGEYPRNVDTCAYNMYQAPFPRSQGTGITVTLLYN